MQVHSDDAGNAQGHVMHSHSARALNDLEYYLRHPRAHALKHLLPAKCDINIT